ncbi:uncharacterized protein LOC133193720 [Saccostrea echinata]|uniref:uncharacterized protein LOC133193720 n=1 Tax=Saccostrea echinata TaxID=191078 RepID=UPI002A841994|nr:uncharacterized protein LOC133193720 [Saccostrea echinata]
MLTANSGKQKEIHNNPGFTLMPTIAEGIQEEEMVSLLLIKCWKIELDLKITETRVRQLVCRTPLPPCQRRSCVQEYQLRRHCFLTYWPHTSWKQVDFVRVTSVLPHGVVVGGVPFSLTHG